MKLKKTEIVEYIVAFVGIVGLLAYIHATTIANPVLNALEVSPMVIESGWTIRADAGRPAGRFRGATYADMRGLRDISHAFAPLGCQADCSGIRHEEAQVQWVGLDIDLGEAPLA